MKELYTSPEVKLTSFIAEENIASDKVEAGDLMGNIASYATGDIKLDFSWFD